MRQTYTIDQENVVATGARIRRRLHILFIIGISCLTGLAAYAIYRSDSLGKELRDAQLRVYHEEKAIGALNEMFQKEINLWKNVLLRETRPRSITTI